MCAVQNKLDYLILEDFLRQHPELTPQERAEILALDQNQNAQPVIVDRDTNIDSSFFGGHVFEESEIKSFFSSNGMSYGSLSQKGISRFSDAGWRVKLTDFIIRHVDSRIVQATANYQDFPIMPGKSLLSFDQIPPNGQLVAEYNFGLYWEWVQNAINTNQDIDDLVKALSVGPIHATKVEIRKKNESIGSTAEEQFVKYSIGFEVNPDPLFWELIDPMDEALELKFRFGLASEKAFASAYDETHYPKNADGNSDYSCYKAGSDSTFSGDVIEPENIGKYFDAFQGAMLPSTPVLTSAKNLAEILLANFILTPENKVQLENLLMDREACADLFRVGLFGPQHQPDPNNQDKLFSLFGLNVSYQIVNATIYQDQTPIIYLPDLLLANGYKIVDLKDGIFCRVLELVIKPEQIEQNKNRIQTQRTPKYSVDAFPLKMEPMSPKDAQILQSVYTSGIAANNRQYFIDPYGLGYHSESQPALIRFCLEHGLWDKLLKQYPFVEPVLQDLDRKAAIDGIEQFYQDIMRMSAYDIAEGRPLTPDSPYYEKNLFGSELLIALQKNPCPKACIAMLLINASFDRHLQDSLPYLLAQFNWFIPGDFAEMTSAHEIVVGGRYETFGNAWYRWDGESFFLLGQRLADIPDKDLMERLNGVTTNSQQFVDWEYNYYKSHEMLVSPDFPESPDIPETLLSGYEFNTYELNAERLIKSAKLETTRKKLRGLETNQGTIQLRGILVAKFTAPEREDVRRLLKHTLDKKTTYFCSLSGEQVELLPDHVFENWIRHSAATGHYDSSSGDIVWAVLFSRNSEKAMDLFEELYSSYSTEPQLSQSKQIISYGGYEHYLSCPSERVTAFLTEHESDLTQNFDPYIYGDKLQLRLHPENELQVLNRAMQSKSWLETKERKFFALTEALFGMKFVSRDISASVIRELFTDDIGSNLAQLLCYLFTDEKTAVPMAGISEWGQLDQNVENSYNVDPKVNSQLVRETLNLLIETNQLTQEIAERFCDNFIIFFGAATIDSKASEELIKKLGQWAESNQIRLTGEFQFLAFAFNLNSHWKINTLKAEDIFAVNSEGTQVFKEEYVNLIKRFNGSLIAPPNYLFVKLHDLFSSFTLPETEEWKDLKVSYDMAMLVVENKPIDPDHVEHVQEALNLVKGYAIHVFDDTEYLKRFFLALHGMNSQGGIACPEQELPTVIYRLYHYSQLDYPKSAIEKDGTQIPFEDIQDVKESIDWTYKRYCFLIQLLIQYQKMGLAFASTPLETASAGVDQDIVDPSQAADPLYRYSLLLAHGLYGSNEALDELQKYYLGEKSLASNVGGMSHTIDSLLNVGAELLKHKRPELFEFTDSSFSLESGRTMAMIELDSPLPHDESLRKLWSNTPEEPGDPRDPTHPTEVMGVLTNVTSGIPSGAVYNIVLEGEYHGVYSEFHKTLQAAITAHDNGEPISAINVSLGVSTRLDLPHQAMDVMEELKRDIDMLSRKGVAIVISAGNDGKGHILNEQGKFLNTLASIDPRIIVVGSSVQTVETDGIYSTSRINTDWEVSGFSGSGTDTYRPDLVAPGENILAEDEFGEQSRVSGTSFSAPYVTRLIVKMKEVNPHLSVEMIQAILKMTAEDIDSSTYYSEGAGNIQPVECLYVAYAMNPLRTAKQKIKMAARLGLSSNQHNLDKLAQWIRWQVWFTNTSRQSYGE